MRSDSPPDPFADASDPVPESVGSPSGDVLRSLEFRSADLAEPFGDRFDTPANIAVGSIVPLPDGSHVQYWTAVHPSAADLVETAEGFPTVSNVRLLRTVDDTHYLEVCGRADSLFAAFHAFDGVTESVVYDETHVRVVAEFPAEVDECAVLDAAREVYPDLELVGSRRVRTVDRFRRRVEERLTDRQLTALRLAYFGGYYDRPRASTGVELAARMGISKQAFHDHLRKATEAVLVELLEKGDDAVSIDE